MVPDMHHLMKSAVVASGDGRFMFET